MRYVPDDCETLRNFTSSACLSTLRFLPLFYSVSTFLFFALAIRRDSLMTHVLVKPTQTKKFLKPLSRVFAKKEVRIFTWTQDTNLNSLFVGDNVISCAQTLDYIQSRRVFNFVNFGFRCHLLISKFLNF